VVADVLAGRVGPVLVAELLEEPVQFVLGETKKSITVSPCLASW
jgi:hypothetical protein